MIFIECSAKLQKELKDLLYSKEFKNCIKNYLFCILPPFFKGFAKNLLGKWTKLRKTFYIAYICPVHFPIKFFANTLKKYESLWRCSNDNHLSYNFKFSVVLL